jgi:succinoglycan biosynthesis protein ExoW
MSCKTPVMIPSCQEEPRILRGAVRSAIAQEGVSDLEVIVVDDGSPAPARDDLVSLEVPAHVTLKLVGRPNRGPGAARNRGLDSVSLDTPYIMSRFSTPTTPGLRTIFERTGTARRE